jgi:type II secretory pathway pseudopilin PulG
MKINYTKTKKSTGFTLIELLIGASIGVIVISAAGLALVNMLRGNQTATAESTKRSEVNRALEFISDEARKAKTIELDPSNEFTTAQSDPDGFNIANYSNAQAILALNIPKLDNVDVAATTEDPVIYFASSVQSGSGSVWKGPRVIYRFGPPLDSSGEYTNGEWTVEPLIDGISDDTVTPNCAGWDAVPAASPVGFYACVRNPGGGATAGETARLYAVGELDGKSYQADTKVFARAKDETLDGDNTKISYGSGCTFNGVFSCPGSGGTPRRYTIDSLGSFFACKPDGSRWTVETVAYSYDSSTTPPTKTELKRSSSSFTVTSSLDVIFEVVPQTNADDSPSCATGAFTTAQQNQSAVSSIQTNGTQDNRVAQLTDASDIETALEKGYRVNDGTEQTSVRDILGSHDLIDTSTGRVNLEENEYVIAFEIGQTDETVDGFDIQDQIILITVNE